MDEILQQFEQPVIDESGERYAVYLYGRSRPGDTWQGWLVFERQNDGRRYATGVETTQPNRQAILYRAAAAPATPGGDGSFSSGRPTAAATPPASRRRSRTGRRFSTGPRA